MGIMMRQLDIEDTKKTDSTQRFFKLAIYTLAAVLAIALIVVATLDPEFLR
jgi:hypothetical protein